MSAEASSAFISYSRKDSAFASRLARDLKEAGADVWLDRLDIAPGELWEVAIEQALSRCSRMLVVLSPSSVETRGVLDEVAFALKKKKKVIPILYLDCEIPYRLDPIQYVDFRVDYDSGVKELLRVLPHKPLSDRPAAVAPRSRPSSPEADPAPKVAPSVQGQPTKPTNRVDVLTPDLRRIRTWITAGLVGAAALALLFFAVLHRNSSNGMIAPAVSGNESVMTVSGKDQASSPKKSIPPPIVLNPSEVTAKLAQDNQQPAVDAKTTGERASKNTVEKRDSDAFLLAKTACESHDFRGCSDLGHLYDLGVDVMQNLPLAVSLYRKACDGGYMSACWDLGYAYSNGRGISRNRPQALASYHKACDGGFAVGCTVLGTTYDDGIRVLPDKSEAASLYRKGCDGGDTDGCFKLAQAYEHGVGLAPDSKEAAVLYRKACDGGNKDACKSLQAMAPSR